MRVFSGFFIPDNMIYLIFYYILSDAGKNATKFLYLQILRRLRPFLFRQWLFDIHGAL